MNNKPTAMMKEKMNETRSREVSPLKSPGNVSQMSAINMLKKEMSVWDAMTIADQERFKKEQQLLAREKRRIKADIDKYNSQAGEAKHSIAQLVKTNEVGADNEFLKRVHHANTIERKEEQRIRQKQAAELVQGVLEGIQNKVKMKSDE